MFIVINFLVAPSQLELLVPVCPNNVPGYRDFIGFADSYDLFNVQRYVKLKQDFSIGTAAS